MSNLILRKDKRWLNKPPLGSTLNYGHPLSRGLVGCWLMNEGGGLISKDLANNAFGVLTAGASFKPNIKGMSVLFDGSNDYIATNSPSSKQSFAGTNKLTLEAIYSLSANGSYPMVMSKGYNQNWAMAHESASRIPRLYLFNTTNYPHSATTALALNTTYHVVWTYDGIQTICYINGKIDKITAVVNNLTEATSYKTLIGADPGFLTTYCFPGNIYKATLYNRALSPSEIQQLYQEPYCFIKPYKKQIWFVISEGAIPVTVTPNVIQARIISQAPTIRISATVSVNTISINCKVQAPTVRANITVSTSAQNATIRTQAVIIRANSTISASVLSSRINLFSPVIRSNIAIALSVLKARILLNSPTISIYAVPIVRFWQLASRIEKGLTLKSRMSKTNFNKSQMEKTIRLKSKINVKKL